MTAPDLTQIKITRNGPYRVPGGVPLARQIIETDADGQSREWREGESFESSASYALCRCGGSETKPFCDGTHARIQFDGTETASRAPYLEQADTLDGPTMELTDAEVLCAFARFCDPDGQVWNLIEETDHQDARDKVKHEAGHCPGGGSSHGTSQIGSHTSPPSGPRSALSKIPS